jgi:predicted PurR-regulated permease PerM
MAESGITPRESPRFTVRTVALLVATGLALYLSYLLAAPFVGSIAWALALAVLFAPFQSGLERRWGRPNLSAATSVVLVGVLVFGASSFIGQRLYVEVVRGAALVETKVGSGEWRRALATQPFWSRLVARVEPQIDLPGAVRSMAAWFSSAAARLVKGSMLQLAAIGFTFYLLFFFLRDRGLALAAARRLSPLEAADTERLFTRIGDTIHATIYGALVVAAVQGGLGGLMFWWLGLPSPLLWGVMMTLLAVVPVLGAAVVWLPAALVLASDGDWGKALILVGWGLLIVGTIDNILRPILVGDRLKLHPVLVFVAVVGGVMLFGPAGLVLGPILVTVTLALLEIWSPGPGASVAP